MTKEVIFILDRSGSMRGLEADTIGGFNGLIEQQKDVPGEVLITTVLFDDAYEILHDHTPLKEVRALTTEQYYVRGTTALLDAVGKTITQVAHRVRKAAGEPKPQVLVVIMTDGMENASSEYSYDVVKTLIDTYQHDAGWEFLFLGANIDAAAAAESIGIRRDRSAHFHADQKGMKSNFTGVQRAMNEFRTTDKMSESWRDVIDADYQSRKKPKKK